MCKSTCESITFISLDERVDLNACASADEVYSVIANVCMYDNAYQAVWLNSDDRDPQSHSVFTDAHLKVQVH